MSDDGEKQPVKPSDIEVANKLIRELQEQLAEQKTVSAIHKDRIDTYLQSGSKAIDGLEKIARYALTAISTIFVLVAFAVGLLTFEASSRANQAVDRADELNRVYLTQVVESSTQASNARATEVTILEAQVQGTLAARIDEFDNEIFTRNIETGGILADMQLDIQALSEEVDRLQALLLPSPTPVAP